MGRWGDGEMGREFHPTTLPPYHPTTPPPHTPNAPCPMPNAHF
ncbi:MAG: hypothetical protein RMY29_011160 [Nostoc sp. CreGUA01]|nr:hypothetical protein [Nostoc sp. CreGUA01]